MDFIERTKRFFGLSFSLANAGFKLRNEGSYLGILWYLLNPVLMFLLLFLIFRDRLGNEIPYYALYLLLGIIMFNFFQDVTLESTKCVREYSGIIKSIRFPGESIVGSVVLKRAFAHIFEVILFTLVLFFIKGSIYGILFYPLIFILFCFFTFGVSLILSSFVVFFVDLDNIWAFFVRLLWLATPIFYSIGGQVRLYVFNLFNPMHYFINLSREIIIYNHLPELWILVGAMFYAILAFFIGIYAFNKLKNKFAEMI
jgi:ABC-type polysaccharide/polyol phosphate export permease